MNFKPCNRYLLLRELPKELEPEKSTILVPDDYKVKENPYGVYEVVEMAPDCTKVPVRTGGSRTKVLVSNSMVEEVSVNGLNMCLVLENYVYGVFGS